MTDDPVHAKTRQPVSPAKSPAKRGKTIRGRPYAFQTGARASLEDNEQDAEKTETLEKPLNSPNPQPEALNPKAPSPKP